MLTSGAGGGAKNFRSVSLQPRLLGRRGNWMRAQTEVAEVLSGKGEMGK